MKTKLMYASVALFSITAQAQVNWFGGPSPSPGGTSSSIRIAGTSGANPNIGGLQIGDATGSLHFSTFGVLIKPTLAQNSSRALLELQEPGGTSTLSIESLNGNSYISNLGTVPLILQTQGGNVGVNYAAGPVPNKISVNLNTSTGVNDGMLITQGGTDNAAMHLTNTNTSGTHWALFSTGSGSSLGAGKFSLFQYTGAGTGVDRLGVDANGKVAINSTAFTNGRLVVQESTAGAGSAGWFNMNSSGSNVGIQAIATGGTQNTALLAQAPSGGGNWAGFFNGNVNINGQAFCTLNAWSSDQKLKKDITALTSALDNIKLLKPSRYNFRTDEFPGMNLPADKQIGLIAQELEKIYPELVSEVPEHNGTDAQGNAVTIPTHKAVNYIGLIPVLVAGIQEQQQAFDKQTQVNADLQQQIEDLKQQLKTTVSTGINSNGSVDASFQMAQNEPNPFTHETVVKYTLPQTVNNAFMAVYDLTGKQITTFPVTERGSSSMTITSDKLAAGIYIYSIVADGKAVDSKRMIVAGK